MGRSGQEEREGVEGGEGGCWLLCCRAGVSGSGSQKAGPDTYAHHVRIDSRYAHAAKFEHDGLMER